MAIADDALLHALPFLQRQYSIVYSMTDTFIILVTNIMPINHFVVAVISLYMACRGMAKCIQDI